ncbi:hypothetical protein GQ53DRAFT_740533 [Thozetella sp. PMI_491]|nr:hypothetical protein GQ53DRAFT_740533 [Thozetella sp. PMI_491]
MSAREKVQILRLGAGASRRACDRCHGHKLRCPRDSEDVECLRCQRAKVSCTTGSQKRSGLRGRARIPPMNQTASIPLNAEALANGRKGGQLLGRLSAPRTDASAPSARAIGVPLHNDVHLGLLGLDEGSDEAMLSSQPGSDELSSYLHVSAALGLTIEDPASRQPAALAFLSQGPWPSWWSADRPETAPRENPILLPGDSQQNGIPNGSADQPPSNTSSTPETAPWTQKLYNLTIKLHQHMQSIPEVKVWNDVWKPTELERAEHAALARDKELLFERTLELSQELTELLNYVWPRFRGRVPAGLDESVHTDLDPPLQLLVMTGYLSLVEAYDKILLNIQSCAQVLLYNDPVPAKEKPPLCLPPMQIGSFEMTSNSSTQVAVLIHVMEAMMMRMCKLVKAMTQKPGGSVLDCEPGLHAAEADITSVTLGALEAREKSTMELLETVRKQVLECGIL